MSIYPIHVRWSSVKLSAAAFTAAGLLGSAPQTVSADLVSSAPPAPEVLPDFSYAVLCDRAQKLAAKPYTPEPSTPLPDFLKKLTLDQYQALRFRPEQGPWRGSPMRFSLQFFHRGYIYQDPVNVYLVDRGHVTDFRFYPGQFDYTHSHFPEPVPNDLQFAGLRILYPLNRPDKQDEVATFIGATYFRLIGARQHYGAAGRGLTINTADPSGEEFPRFTEFWIQKPAPEATNIEFFALLDSPSAAGAYHFLLTPGAASVLEVQASLVLRREVKKLGLAPLTSMMYKSTTRLRFVPDYRPQVHDSDGLLLAGADSSWSWRPLNNPDRDFNLSQFSLPDPAGFGLFQRERDFFAYEDLGTRFELRPSLWVQPEGKWGAGVVELVEIPSPSDANDNIIAYWLANQKPAPGQEFRWAYKISALLVESPQPALYRVLSTFISPPHDKVPVRFIIDFEGQTPPEVPPKAPVEAEVQVSRGQVQNLGLEKNEVTGGWRASFNLVDAGDHPVELRLFLRSAAKRLSEVWLYHLKVP